MKKIALASSKVCAARDVEQVIKELSETLHAEIEELSAVLTEDSTIYVGEDVGRHGMLVVFFHAPVEISDEAAEKLEAAHQLQNRHATEWAISTTAPHEHAQLAALHSEALSYSGEALEARAEK